MLRDRYYLGDVSYKGEEFPGRHQPLVTSELFERVQAVMDSRSGAGVRQRQHHHYLKGSLWCGECHDVGRESRMILNRSVGRRGGEYFYYFCRGRQDHVCESRYLDVALVEDAVSRHYAQLRLPKDFVAFIRGIIDETLADEEVASDLLRKHLRKELDRIDRQEENLLDLAADGTLASAKVRSRLTDLKSKRLKVKGELDRMNKGLVQGGEWLNMALDLLGRPFELYRRFGPEQRRELNMQVFEKIYISEDGVTDHRLHEPFNELVGAHQSLEGRSGLGPTVPFELDPTVVQKSTESSTQSTESESGLLAAAISDGGWSKALMVGVEGFEPSLGTF